MNKTICIILTALVIGCFGIEAKTTKKSGKKKYTTSKVVDNKTNRILKQIPSFDKLWSTENWKVLFQNLGYEITTKTVENELYDYMDDQDYYVTLLTATKQFEDGGKVIFEEDICGNYRITIKGMPQVLEKYLKEIKTQAKQFNRKYGDGIFYMTIERNGDQIMTHIPCN